ncbi:hypothetical protein HDU97_002587 [Phlyctochytrium planicorne]|nr:hypothetical protein HDU97_002587 [Phlyctochytrium planicorne]
MRKSQTPLSERSMVHLINAHAILGNWHEVVGLGSGLDLGTDRSLLKGPLSKSLVRAHASLRDFKSAARIVKQAETFDPDLAAALYNILIPSYIKERDLISAVRCVRRMKERNLLPSARILAYLWVGLAAHPLKRDYVNIHAEAASLGIDLESHEDFLQNLTTAYSALGYISDALDSLRQLRRVSTDALRLQVAYSSVIDAELKSGVQRGSLGVFSEAKTHVEEMIRDGIQPNVRTFTSFLHASYRIGGLGKLLEHFSDMQASGIRPDQHAFNILIRAYTLDNKPNKALLAYEDMLKEGLAPNLKVQTSVIAAMAILGNMDKMRNIFDDVSSSGAFLDHSLFHVFMNGFANQKDLASCLEWYDRLLSSGLRPDVFTYTILMYAVAKSIDAEAMGRWFEKLFSAEIRPNVYTYSLMIHEKSKQGELAAVSHLFNEMMEAGVPPSHVTYTILTNAFVKNAMKPNALNTVNLMLLEGSRPDILVCYTAMKAFNQSRDHAKILSLYNKLPVFGLQPTDLMDFVLIRSSVRASDFESCERALNSLRERCIELAWQDEGQTVFERVIMFLYERSIKPKKTKKTRDDTGGPDKSTLVGNLLDGLCQEMIANALPFSSRCMAELFDTAVKKFDGQRAVSFFKGLWSLGKLGSIPREHRDWLYATAREKDKLLCELVAMSVTGGNLDDIDALGIFDSHVPAESRKFRKLMQRWNMYGQFLGQCSASKNQVSVGSRKFIQLLKNFTTSGDAEAVLSLWSSMKVHPAAPPLDLVVLQAFLEALAILKKWTQFVEISTAELLLMFPNPQGSVVLANFVGKLLLLLPDNELDSIEAKGKIVSYWRQNNVL